MNKNTFTFVCATLLITASPLVWGQNIAVVNGQRITKARADFILKTVTEQFHAAKRPTPPNLEANIKNKLIENAVQTQAAEAQKLQLTQEYAMRMEEAREAILAQLLFNKYKEDHPISDAAARQEYDKLAASFAGGQEFRARHILVKTEAEALRVQAELKKGVAFDALATRLSQDPGSAKNGGDLGWSPDTAYVPEFGAALRALKKGETTAKPIKTQFGYHVIRLQDTRSASVPPFESVKDDLKAQMQNQQMEGFKKYVDDLKAKAKIQ